MNAHERYVQQSSWTRELRTYLFGKAGLAAAKRVLEVGCGTGAILGNVAAEGPAAVHGLDLDPSALVICRSHVPPTALIQGDVCSLPYFAGTFDIAYCHFLLLWVHNPLLALLEMKRVTRPGGCVLALAEPDYTRRVDQPVELSSLGKLQAESLRRQGADIAIGSRLADLFRDSGIPIIQAGEIQRRESRTVSAEEWENEWSVLEADLAGVTSTAQIKKMKHLDLQAREDGRRVLHVPTYFAWGQV